MSERERIELLMKCYGLSPSQFADKTGIQRASVSHILSGRNKPSLEVMLKIFDAFPSIDMKWLMTGIGEAPVATSINAVSQENLFPDEEPVHSIEQKTIGTQSQAALYATTRQAAIPSLQPEPKQVQHKQQRKATQGRQQTLQSAASQRRIKEVRIFYTDGTYETLLPEKL